MSRKGSGGPVGEDIQWQSIRPNNLENIREIKIMRGMHGKRRGKEKKGKSKSIFLLKSKADNKKKKNKGI